MCCILSILKLNVFRWSNWIECCIQIFFSTFICRSPSNIIFTTQLLSTVCRMCYGLGFRYTVDKRWETLRQNKKKKNNKMIKMLSQFSSMNVIRIRRPTILTFSIQGYLKIVDKFRKNIIFISCNTKCNE